MAHFSAKIEDKQDYLRPMEIDFDRKSYILQVGPHKMSTNDWPEIIAESAQSLKATDNNIVLLASVPRNDKLAD